MLIKKKKFPGLLAYEDIQPEGWRCRKSTQFCSFTLPTKKNLLKPCLRSNLCKLNKCSQKCIIWGDLSVCFGDSQQISGNGEVVWVFFLIYSLFLLDIFSITIINYMLSISSLPCVTRTPGKSPKRLSVSESSKSLYYTYFKVYIYLLICICL